MIKAIIIDDEEDSRQMLDLALRRYCPNVEILALCESATEGLQCLENHHPDIVFLDVQMPLMSGFDFLEKVHEPDFHIIFVTSYNQYAIKAIKFSALDYLLKPIDAEELVSAVNRASEKSNPFLPQYRSVVANMSSPSKRLSRLAIPTDNEIHLQQVADIVYCKADGSYTELYLVDGQKRVVSKNIKAFENMLADSGFFRIHHSFLVNTSHIEKYVRGEGGYVIVTGEIHLTVARRKKDFLLQVLHDL